MKKESMAALVRCVQEGHLTSDEFLDIVHGDEPGSQWDEVSKGLKKLRVLLDSIST